MCTKHITTAIATADRAESLLACHLWKFPKFFYPILSLQIDILET